MKYFIDCLSNAFIYIVFTTPKQTPFVKTQQNNLLYKPYTFCIGK